MGKAAHFLGPVGTGSKMKLVVNMTMGTMMNSLVRMLLTESFTMFCRSRTSAKCVYQSSLRRSSFERDITHFASVETSSIIVGCRWCCLMDPKAKRYVSRPSNLHNRCPISR